MSIIYDNWERLVAAVLRKQQLWELFHSDSIKTSICSTPLDLSSHFDSIMSFNGAHDYDLVIRKNYDENEREVVRSTSDEVLEEGNWVAPSYRAEKDNGITIVVKRLRGLERNLKILDDPMTYFSYDEDEKVIVYEYQSQGSEFAMLHGKKFGNPISWKSRLRIAIGLAKAIALIHAKDNRKKLLHSNTKALDYLDLNSKTDDSSPDPGLDNTLEAWFVIPTIGYRSPEVVYANNVSQASDVYSFGVVLLDLLTGRYPLNDIGVNTMNLVRWVTSMFHEKGTLLVFEFVPVSNPNDLIEMWKMLLVAMSCVVENPDQRPKSLDVVKMMEDITSPLR